MNTKQKATNKGRITRKDQAWDAAQREYIERQVDAAGSTKLTVVRDPVPTRETLVVRETDPQPIPASLVAAPSETLTVPLRFVYAALLAAAKDDIRYYLNGVYVHAVDGEIRVCGTDGHRMAVSRFKPEEAIPAWAEAGFILPREGLAQALPVLSKHGSVSGHDADAALIIQHQPGTEAIVVKSFIEFAAFRLKPVDGKFPDYSKVLASAGQSLVNEREAMGATSINAAYLKGAAEISARLGAKAINSFMGDGQAAAVFTFVGAPDTLLIIMPMRTAGEVVPEGVVKLFGPAGVAASISALKAHVTRTVKALTSAKGEDRKQLEARKTGFEERIAYLQQACADAPAVAKQIEHKAAA